MNWIRIAVGIMHDPAIHAVADAVGVSVPTTTGHVVGVLACLPEHCRSGDLSKVSDATMERWAMWGGKRGKFAGAFRAYLCDAQGVVKAWEKHNGAAMREAETDRQRKKAWRDVRRMEREASAGRPPDVRVVSTRNGTERNGTEQQQELPESGDSLRGHRAAQKRAAPKAGADKAWPLFSQDDRGRVLAAFKRIGVIPAGRIINAIAPQYLPPEDPAHVPHQYVTLAVEDYCGVIGKGRSAPFASPEDCAKKLMVLAANCRRFEEAHDPVGRADANFMAIHGHKMPGAA